MGPRIAFVCTETDGSGGSCDRSIVKYNSLLGYPKIISWLVLNASCKNAPISFIITAWKESITAKLISLNLILGDLQKFILV
jgi:hypothetical protein